MSDLLDASFKISLFGNGGVGKTTLTRRFLTGFYELDTKVTMGAQIHVKYMDIEGIKVGLQIWDFGGEEEFKFLLPVYSKGSHAGILMFDITRYNTIKNIDDWVESFYEGAAEEESPIMLVGGKLDQHEKRAVSIEEAEQIAKEKKFFKYIECSAASGENVGVIFEDLTRKMLENVDMI